jgi:hypothetical protein
MTTTENSLTDDLVTANKIIDRAELAVPFGHVSVRIPLTDRVFISRAIAPGVVTNSDILVVM